MKTITINCPDDSGIISVVVVGRQRPFQVWANQQLREVKNGDVITIRKPDEEGQEIEEQAHE